jgi:hypothetical protein
MRDQPAETHFANLRLWLTVGWLIVAFHAFVYARMTYFYWLHALPKIVVVSFCLVAVIGCWRKWGLAILLPLAGFYFGAFYYRPYGYAHDAWEAMMEDIGFPVVFACFGLVVGAVFELRRVLSKIGKGGQPID